MPPHAADATSSGRRRPEARSEGRAEPSIAAARVAGVPASFNAEFDGPRQHWRATFRSALDSVGASERCGRPRAAVAARARGRRARGRAARVARRWARSWPRVDAAIRAVPSRSQGRVALVYGVNTGCGPLCDRTRAAGGRRRFQANLVRSHAERPRRRASDARSCARRIAVRALTLAQGRSGVRPRGRRDARRDAERRRAARVIPEIGLGRRERRPRRARARGARRHGRGQVCTTGARRPAAEALAAAGLAPARASRGARALALMNGTACETAQAALLLASARETLVDAAEAAAGARRRRARRQPRGVRPRGCTRRGPHAGQLATAARTCAAASPAAERVRDGARARGARRAAGAEPVQDAVHAPLRAAGARRRPRDARPRARS